MKFSLDERKYFYPSKIERDKLEKLGFHFIQYIDSEVWHIDDHPDRMPEIEINTLEELCAFRNRYGDIIISMLCHCESCLGGDTQHFSITLDNDNGTD
jgi:hypothetical protein